MPVKVKMMASDLDWYLDEDGELLPHAYNETPRYIDHDRGDHSYAKTKEENTLNKEKEREEKREIWEWKQVHKEPHRFWDKDIDWMEDLSVPPQHHTIPGKELEIEAAKERIFAKIAMTIDKPVSTLLSDDAFVDPWNPKMVGGTGIASAKKMVQHVLHGINTGRGYSFIFIYYDDVLMFSDTNNIVVCSETLK